MFWRGKLVRLVGVVTRASSKIVFHAFFVPTIQTTIPHGHAKPPYRTTYQSRLRRKRDDRIGICEANPPWAKQHLWYLRTPKHWFDTVSKNLLGAETQFPVRHRTAFWIDSSSTFHHTSSWPPKPRNRSSVGRFAECIGFITEVFHNENGVFTNGFCWEDTERHVYFCEVIQFKSKSNLKQRKNEKSIYGNCSSHWISS